MQVPSPILAEPSHFYILDVAQSHQCSRSTTELSREVLIGREIELFHLHHELDLGSQILASMR